MVTGKTVGEFRDFELTEGQNAERLIISDLSNPKTQHNVLAFDDTTVQYVDFPVYIENYDGGGFQIDGTLTFASATGATNKCRMEFSIHTLDNGEIMDATFTHTFDGVTVAADATNNNVKIDFTLNMTNIDGLADGRDAIVRARRNTGHADDNATGDVYLLYALCRMKEQ